MAGTVGAIFNGALQLGSAVGVSAVGSIEASVEATHGSTSYAGRAAGFWFLLAVVTVEFVCMLLFHRIGKEDTSVRGIREATEQMLEVEKTVEKVELGEEKMPQCIPTVEVYRSAHHVDVPQDATSNVPLSEVRVPQQLDVREPMNELRLSKSCADLRLLTCSVGHTVPSLVK